MFGTPERAAPRVLKSPPRMPARNKRAFTAPMRAADLDDAVHFAPPVTCLQKPDADEAMFGTPEKTTAHRALQSPPRMPARAKRILASGADPNATCDGISAISACIVSASRPPLLFQCAPRLPPLDGSNATALVRTLLIAGAKPTADDLYKACSS